MKHLREGLHPSTTALLGTGVVAMIAMAFMPERAPESLVTDSLPLTVEYGAYPYSAEIAAARKGGGDTGMANRALKVGEVITAECMVGDGVRIKTGEFAGLVVNTEVHVLQPDGATYVAQRVFNKPTDVIALKLAPCES